MTWKRQMTVDVTQTDVSSSNPDRFWVCTEVPKNVGTNNKHDNTEGFSTGPQMCATFPQGNSTDASQLPLDGIRVLDLTRVLAGPYCTMILGDYGAEVIKVENPSSGDDTRSWGPPYAPNLDANDKKPGESAYFLGINRNKKSITVNFKSAEGLGIIKDLVAKSDVLVENFVPGTLDKLGLGYKDFQPINPGLIYASITGYGPTGPYAKNPGYDVIIEAEAGLMHITGEPDGPPVKVGVAMTDMTTGLYAKGAILAALLARARTGKGQKIDISLLECQVASLANIAHNYLIGGQEAKRQGTQHASIVPYQAFSTEDSYIVVGAGNDGQFQKLCARLEMDHLSRNPKFATNSSRVQNRSELIKILSDRFQSNSTAYWLSKFEGIGIPYAPVNNIEQTFEHPQVKHREMIQEVDHPRSGKVKLVGIPVKFSESKPSIRRAPPTHGQHTEDVLKNLLGYSDKQIGEFKTRGAI
ncbi:CoA-transferase family III domain-containing protein [Phlyctochytrium arcticum]|nr:CoA-transferase family III domain-containing protein [Phlyctochytrium arcticum]